MIVMLVYSETCCFDVSCCGATFAQYVACWFIECV